jgi:hypothetical protein
VGGAGVAERGWQCACACGGSVADALYEIACKISTLTEHGALKQASRQHAAMHAEARSAMSRHAIVLV